jgi:hypothetical protein
MSTSSEAVMVSPEQCATAPKVLSKELASSSSAQTPTATRLVLLSVLALAAATGAMFGVVIFGNEFTKDLHPKGDTYTNAVTLVDMNDRAIATADVESYVSLLDVPLLGTAELNKIDGITFSTHVGVQHRKITGYDVSKETATIGGSVVQTPLLTLKTAEDDTVIVISVRDSKAWMQQTSSGVSITTAIDLTSQRRLASDAGSCLANGACLYSSDELMQASKQTRELSEGSFFARADVAAYQVDLSGDDVMEYLDAPNGQVTYLDGSYVEDGHELRVRAESAATGSILLFTNKSSGVSKLLTKNGTWIFKGDETTGCTRPTDHTAAITSTLDPKQLAISGSIPFDVATVKTSEPIENFIPSRFTYLSMDDCLEQMIGRSNMSDPVVQDRVLGHVIHNGNSMRKLAQEHFKPLSAVEKHKASYDEMLALMQDGNNEINQFWASKTGTSLRKLRKLEETMSKRELVAAGDIDTDFFGGDSDNYAYDYSSMKTYQTALIADMSFSMISDTFGVSTYISHFDLWVCTRLADPTFLYNAYEKFDDYSGIVDTVGTSSLDPSFLFDMSGTGGISQSFAAWALFTPVQAVYTPKSVYADIEFLYDSTSMSSAGYDSTSQGTLDIMDSVDNSLSMAFYHAMYPGSCSGGYEFNNDATMSSEVGVSLCEHVGFAKTGETATASTDVFSGKFSASSFATMYADTRRRLSEDEVVEGAYPHLDRNLIGVGSGSGASLRMGEDILYKALSEYCQDFMDGNDPSYTHVADGYTYEFGLKQGNSWASYLKKEVSSGYPEYVVAFQGTKASDHTMIQYNIQQQPVFTYIGTKPSIVPEGYFAYMSSLVDCMTWIILDADQGGWDVYPSATTTFLAEDMQPKFITGHSLGGAAATLFAKADAAWTDPGTVSNFASGTTQGISGKYPRLVTFGASPVAYRSQFSDSLITCKPGVGYLDDGTPILDSSSYCGSDGYLTAAGFKEWAKKVGGMSNFCGSVNPDGVRFFHKFDPVPSIAMWKGQYAHGVEHAMLLYDMPKSSCSVTSTCAISSGTASSKDKYGLGGSDPLTIKDYLCDKWDVLPKAHYTSCYDKISSYMSLLNPWPCGQIIFHRMWKEEWETSQSLKVGDNGVIEFYWGEDGKVAVLDVVDLQTGLFQKFEEYTDCVAGYEATLGAYIQSAIIDLPEVSALAFAVFGFTWVHSAYGNYPLCTESSGGKILSTNVDSSDEAKVEIMSDGCGSTISQCEADCNDEADYSNYECFDECTYSCFTTSV